MAYVILLHLVYLLSSILRFNSIETYYTLWVQVNLIKFMTEIRNMLVKSSTYLLALMEILIIHFCDLINSIFEKIKAKLLFYLKFLYSYIILDYLELYDDIESLIEWLSKLKSDLIKYISISQMLNQFLNALNELTTDNTKLKERINNIIKDKTIQKVQHIFYYKGNKISKIIGALSTIKLEKSIELGPDNVELFMNFKMNLDNIQEKSKDVIKMSIDKPLIVKFKSCACSIKNIFDIIDMGDVVVTEEIIAIIRQLLEVETINLVKLNLLISKIQLKYLEILIRIALLLCTIKFYNEIQPTISTLIGLMKFDCRKVSEFLFKCSEVEKYISSVSSSINECIKNLATSLNGCKLLGLGSKLVRLYVDMIRRIMFLKFYVDLMMLEILIFKMIFINLIVMSVSSAILDALISEIGKIRDIDKAIPTLIVSEAYLRTFYFIQLENTLVIFGLSNVIIFSESIHGYYDVLIINLYLINVLIWGIECYINHLFVFRYVSKGLNGLIDNIVGLKDIIDQISSTVKSMFTISDMLKSIDKSIKQLNEIQFGMDIKNWKESANKIRHQTESINRDIVEINLQFTEITGKVGTIHTSWLMLIYLESFLLVLILQVHNYILNSNDPKVLGSGIQNKYYSGMIMSMMEPCNKQIKFILGYLVDMWVNILKLIKVVETAIGLIIVKLELLYSLSEGIQSHISNINKGVVDLECAIQGVARNLILCTINRVSPNLINHYRENNNLLDKYVLGMYSLLNVMDCGIVVNTIINNNPYSVLK